MCFKIHIVYLFITLIFAEIIGDPNLFNKNCNVLRLKFEVNDGDRVYDSSEQRNEVFLKDGAGLTDKGIISGKAVNLGNDGKIYVGSKFKGKPRKSVAISLWVKLENEQGNHSLFRATDLNNVVHYQLLSRDGKVSWIHHGDDGKELFRVQSDRPVLKARKWQHIVGVYNYQSSKASLWLDGRKLKEKNAIQGHLAQKWSLLSVFGGRTKGLMDNIQLFRCPLDRTKVVALYVATASPKEDKKSLVEKPHKTPLKQKKSKIRLSEKLKIF